MYGYNNIVDVKYSNHVIMICRLAIELASVSGQLSDRMNYQIKHPITILRKYPGLDYQKLANHFKEAQLKWENCSKDCVL